MTDLSDLSVNPKHPVTQCVRLLDETLYSTDLFAWNHAQSSALVSIRLKKSKTCSIILSEIDAG